MADTEPIRNRWANRLFVIFMVLAAFAASIGGALYLLRVAEESTPADAIPTQSSGNEADSSLQQ